MHTDACALCWIQAANPLAVQLAADVGVTITWGIWAKAAIVPGIVSLLLMPLVVYIIAPPTISNAADAPRMARRKLVRYRAFAPQ